MKTQNKTKTIVPTLLSAILLLSVLSSNAYAEDKNPNVNTIKIEYTTKIAKDTHYIQFKTCIGNKHAKTPTFIINSDLGTKTITFQKLHEANTCKSYETKANAKHFASIKINMSERSGFV